MKKVNFEGDVAVDPEFLPIDKIPTPTESIKKQLWQESDDFTNEGKGDLEPPGTQLNPTTTTPPPKMTPCKRKKSPGSSAEKENKDSSTPKRPRPLGFLTSSPRPLGSKNSQNRTPVHLKQTIATAKKRLVRDTKQSVATTKRITASTKKRAKKGMNDAVALALQQSSDFLP